MGDELQSSLAGNYSTSLALCFPALGNLLEETEKVLIPTWACLSFAKAPLISAGQGTLFVISQRRIFLFRQYVRILSDLQMDGKRHIVFGF